MAQDIAVCIGENGLTSSLYDSANIVIYQKIQGNWQISREIKFVLDRNYGIAGLRRQMAEVILFLGQTKVFVGGPVVGVPYFELEKAQCSIWEIEGNPLSFLDYVLEKEEETQQRQNEQQIINTIPIPQERDNGCYYISIKDIQENNPGITSKQVLQPFLQQGKFFSLEIICNHVPPWLELAVSDGKLTSICEKIGPKEIKLTIARKCCET
ncbi:MAG TPA: Fe-only nitrogenase accessory AnfO family protein [Negativicutes bacterium]|jgi:Fe-only nitrogenase accessory protein AnfO